jgi:hypothetical protein
MDQAKNPLGAAQAELASVRSQIDALQKREQKLQAFIDLGRELFSSAIDQELAAPPSDDLNVFERMAIAQRPSMKARILELAREAIQKNGPMHTRDLLAYVERAGVSVTGADKLITVSVILSRSDEFKSDRTAGWSFQEKTPQDVAASAGSSTA